MKSREERPTSVLHESQMAPAAYVRACLELANWREGDDVVAAVANFGRVIARRDAAGGLFAKIGQGSLSEHVIRSDGRRKGELPAGVRDLADRLSGRLRQFLAAKGRARQVLRATANAAIETLQIDTTAELDADDHLVLVHRFFPGSADGAEGLLLVFLFDPKLPFGRELRACALESCGRYFLASKNPAGGPRRRYHTAACQLEADALRAPERARRNRPSPTAKHK
jgi:hypothetical protein